MQSTLHNVIGPKEVHPRDLAGRTAVVTGGALGIGYEISRALAHAGCKVIMVNRKEDQGAEAISKIKNESPEADVDWKECDLGSLKQVRTVFSSPFALDADGIDRHFGVNYLGHYYATNQLWPLIRKTSKMPGVSPPRIVAESSKVHQFAPSNTKFESMDEINDSQVDPTHLYGRTKLALILFTRFGLVEKVIKPSGDAIYAVSVHPGTVNTAMQEQWKDAYPGVTGTLISWAMKSVGRDPEQGAYSALWALTAPEIAQKDQNGGYFEDPGKEGSLSSQATNMDLGAALWELSARIVKDKLGDDALIDWSGR